VLSIFDFIGMAAWQGFIEQSGKAVYNEDVEPA
jgi:hypothetical protein